MEDNVPHAKTMLITVSSGIGSRLYDHRSARIPYDPRHGVQGEIGHLVCSFELDGNPVRRRCECGGWNHVNAFASGRGIAQILRDLPELTSRFTQLYPDAPSHWRAASDDYRLTALQTALDARVAFAIDLLRAFVTPLTRILATTLTLDPEVERIVITGGVARGLHEHYRSALLTTFECDGLYQISRRDPEYLRNRLHWAVDDDFAGLRGAGMYVERAMRLPGNAQRDPLCTTSNG
jgi:glucokinase